MLTIAVLLIVNMIVIGQFNPTLDSLLGLLSVWAFGVVRVEALTLQDSEFLQS
jgi:hypothetical protein